MKLGSQEVTSSLNNSGNYRAEVKYDLRGKSWRWSPGLRFAGMVPCHYSSFSRKDPAQSITAFVNKGGYVSLLLGERKAAP